MREEGYYWVQYGVYGRWWIAEWTGHCWQFTGDFRIHQDSEMNEIDENQITREPT